MTGTFRPAVEYLHTLGQAEFLARVHQELGASADRLDEQPARCQPPNGEDEPRDAATRAKFGYSNSAGTGAGTGADARGDTGTAAGD